MLCFQNSYLLYFVSRILKKCKVSKILITGGTGLVGTHLTNKLIAKGHEVAYLSRSAGEQNGIKRFKWDIKDGYIDPEAFAGVTAVINLAGAGIADKRWSASYKKELYDSRILSTRLLVEKIRLHQLHLDAFVSTSAIGIYGNHTTHSAIESDAAASDFLAQLCKDWEAEANGLPQTRKVIIRVGIVLAKESGFIPQVAGPIKWGVGAVLGKGNQKTSWIHIDDLCGAYIKAIEDNEMQGVYNAVAPSPETNKIITQEMARKLHRPLWLPPVPGWALALLFGEMSSALLANLMVSSAKLQQEGFHFAYPQLQNALDNLLPDTK
jgi:uncharacterized protein